MPVRFNRDWWSPPTRARVVDVLLAGATAILGLTSVPDGPGPSSVTWVVAIVATSVLLLVLRRRAPLVAALGILAVWGAVHADRAVDDPPFQFLALLCVAFALGAYESAARGAFGLATIAGVFVAMNLARDLNTADTLAGPIQLGAVYAFGTITTRGRRRRSQLESDAARLAGERDARAAAAVVSERARIARDIHDALGHAISLMTLQVGAVRTALEPHQEREREALLAAEGAGRASVLELRRVLGILRESPVGLAPPGSLSELDAVVERVRAAGVKLEVERAGEPAPVSPGVEFALYRIAQEALTNAVRHAPGAAARLRIAHDPQAVTIAVTTDAGAPAPGSWEIGQGLTGIRERVGAYGGSLRLGPTACGGFEVVARLPVDGGGP